MAQSEKSEPTRLVVDVGQGGYVWVQSGKGWFLGGGGWTRLDEAGQVPGFGGTVLHEREVTALVEKYGCPAEVR